MIGRLSAVLRTERNPSSCAASRHAAASLNASNHPALVIAPCRHGSEDALCNTDVIPAEIGIQSSPVSLDPGFRRSDDGLPVTLF